MESMSIRSVNLNLMPVLRALLHERSVARAAVALDLSPAATSEALCRLRSLLGDPLLVRVGRTMKLTEKAATLVEPVNRLCEEAEALLHQGEGFAPATSTRHFKIATNDSLTKLIAQPLLNAVRQAAPRVQLHFSDAQGDVFDQLSARDIDVVVMPQIFFTYFAPSQSILVHSVLRDHLVLAFSTEHALARLESVTLEDIAPYPQILYNQKVALVEGRQEREFLGGLKFNVAARLQQLTLIPALVAAPPYVALIPKSLADAVKGELSIKTRALPFETPSLDVCVAWSAVRQKDAAHLWFRTKLMGILAHMNPADTAAQSPGWDYRCDLNAADRSV